MERGNVSILIDQLRVGGTSAYPLVDDNGLLLLGENTCITEQVIIGLRERGIDSIFVDSRDVAVLCDTQRKQQAPSERETRNKEPDSQWVRSKPVKEMLIDRHDEDLNERRSNQLNRAMGVAKQRVDELKSRILTEKIRSVGALSEISDVYAHSMVDDHDHTVGTIGTSISKGSADERSIRMSVLGMAIAIELGHDGVQTLEVGMAGMLHDVGLYAMDSNYHKPIELLSESERWEYRKHPNLSVLCLSDVIDLPESVKMAIQQVHEQFDGSGYPYGVHGRRIQTYARILNVVDTYLELTSTMPHRPAIVPHDALGFMLHQASRGMFDPQVMRAFLSIETLFPLGSMVELTSGEIARVIRRPRSGFASPVLLGQDGNRIELEKETDVKVVRPACDSAVDQIRLTPEMMQSSHWHPASNPAIV